LQVTRVAGKQKTGHRRHDPTTAPTHDGTCAVTVGARPARSGERGRGGVGNVLAAQIVKPAKRGIAAWPAENGPLGVARGPQGPEGLCRLQQTARIDEDSHERTRMRISVAAGFVAILVSLSASTAQAQAPAPAGTVESGAQTEPDRPLLIHRIDAERLRQIRNERTREFILAGGLIAAGGLIGVSKTEWPVDERVIGIALGFVGLSLFIDALSWRDLEVKTTTNGVTLEW